MKRGPQEFRPLARRQGMVIKEVDDEVLVYDLVRDQAHCLNPSAAAIWRRCDGKTTTSVIASTVAEETGKEIGEDFIWLGLQDLVRNHLLESGSPLSETLVGKSMTRREAVRRLGFGAAVALPLVMSITAPTAVQAANSCDGRCKPCSSGSQCCSGVCAMDVTGCDGGVNTRRCT